MLKKTQVTELIDDIDGTPADTSINFSVGGIPYVIDLSEANLREFKAVLAPYIKHGRRAAARKPRSAAGRAKRQNAAEIRAWGIEKGYLKSARGRLGTTVIAAYEAAHQNTDAQ
ncbi:MAG: Lsr2 family protein [Rothia mucilaginosa]|uniref:Lsr2 family protein n=1 Tax=Rothia mucilaginosa TaxID=43675 RepID=A0A930PVA3_9MICC|nr:Lsr2 family protein [Rothia mucilaginosa]MBF1664445.1 Lsr2 family protein [Rothia mucilaginosa]